MGARCAGGRYFKVLCSPKILDVPPRAASRGCGSALVWPPSAFLGFWSGFKDPHGRMPKGLSGRCFGTLRNQVIH